ncbi:MAG: acyltransferase [Chitinophagaceae bacterium]|nr:acyltransferase [Bacteroidota bacterium]MCC6256841.1 acyltransferase [Chitinophagaceae bacterium]MCW5916979.1 acyltransferase [Ferruginibacter sp.]
MNFLKKVARKIVRMGDARFDHNIKGNRISIHNKGKFREVVLDIEGNDIEISIGTNTLLHGTLIFVRGNNQKISIGENCYFGKGELWIEDDGGSILLQDFCTVQSGHFAVTEGSSISLGRDCMLAHDIEIRTGDSHSIIDLESGNRMNIAAPVILEEHVWVGAHSRILKGVKLGSHSIIGTSSVVSSAVPPNSIAAGMPAKVIRTGVTWTRERN